ETRAYAPIPLGDLPRRAADGRDDEQMARAGIHEPATILAEMQIVHDARRRGPLGTLGRSRHVDLPLGLLLHEHREAYRLAVRRPLDVARRFRDAGDLRRCLVSAHPADED